MNKEEIIEYINAKRKPISHCVDLTKYFIGRHKTLPVYLTKAFEQEFNYSMYELEKLREENKKYKEVIDKLKEELIDSIPKKYEIAEYSIKEINDILKDVRI